MSVSSEYLPSKNQPGTAPYQSSVSMLETDEKESPESRLESGQWDQVVLGAIALGLYMLLAATSEAIWPVLLGPFMLLGIARLMGLQSLWKRNSSGHALKQRDTAPRN